MENRDLPAAPFSQGVQDIVNTLSRKKIFCILESFNTNTSHQLFLLQNNFCEFTTLEHKIKR